jgi:cellulose synthase/poly-beta-1,6-N-acetylglucosamine synthase-like glycosyltransferase
MLYWASFMFKEIKDIVVYIALFAGLYFQVFLLVSYFLWNGKTEFGEIDEPTGEEFEPTVAIIVPCFNEEKTVVKTVNSLLALDYPREKLQIVVVDDGSTDGTWNEVQQFVGNISVVLLQKKNEGSKFAAMNFALRYIKNDMPNVGIIGCLDADSTVHHHALRESLKEFTKPGVMAVVPSMVIYQPQTFMQYMQKVEYELATYAKQAFSRLNTLYIAPGPFTLMRREVFDVLGEYNEAHHVEDMEIALRMQLQGMRLSHAVNSLVYTSGPRTWPTLLKQRVRWTYGFIMNVWDYRKRVFFNDHLGHVAVTIPMLFAMTWLMVVMLPFLILSLIFPITHLIQRISVTHQVIGKVQVEPFYISTSVFSILTLITLAIFFVTIFIGRKKLLHQKMLSLDLLTTIVYPFFAAWWTGQSAFNAVRGKKKSWR